MFQPRLNFGLRSAFVITAVVAVAIVVARPWILDQIVTLQIQSNRSGTAVLVNEQWRELPVEMLLSKDFSHPGVTYSADYTSFVLSARSGRSLKIVFVNQQDQEAFRAAKPAVPLNAVPMKNWRVTSSASEILVVGKE
jgi:hypothetical protein